MTDEQLTYYGVTREQYEQDLADLRALADALQEARAEEEERERLRVARSY